MINYFNIFKRVSLLKDVPITISNHTTITKTLSNNTIIKPEFELTPDMSESIEKLSYKNLKKTVEEDLKIINGHK